MRDGLENQSKFVPLYIQIYRLLKEAIDNKEYQPGDKLPSETELIHKYEVSRTTAISAIEKLADEGLVYRERGKGTFVASPVVNDFSFHQSFSKHLQDRNFTPGSRLISVDVCEMGSEITQKLDVQTDEDHFCLVRIRLADNEPVALQYAYLPTRRVPNLDDHDFEDTSLFRILREDYKIEPAWAEAVVEARLANPEEAEYLNIKEDQPILLIWHKTLDEKYRPIEYVRSVYRSDRLSFSTGRSRISP